MQETSPTIWDYTSLGDRETLLSATLAWLLDAQGSHGLGTAFLDQFLQRVGMPPAGGRLLVQPEAREGARRRYDICLQNEAGVKCIVEVKSKGFGSAEQLQKYAETGSQVLRVGFEEWNYELSQAEREEFPLIRIEEIAGLVDGLVTGSAKYSQLLLDFAAQLKREAETLNGIRAYFITETTDKRPAPSSHLRPSERFYNILFWRLFVDRWEKEHAEHSTRVWEIKSESSGVWCANHGGSKFLAEGERFHAPLLGLDVPGPFFFWTHLELHGGSGVFARKGGTIGSVQLRISGDTPIDNRRRIFGCFKGAEAVIRSAEFHIAGKQPSARQSYYTVIRRNFPIEDFRYSTLKPLISALAGVGS